MRFGITLGGISTVGFVVELFDGGNAIDLAAGTWTFRDLALSAVYKRYIGGRALRPFVGGGLWAVVGAPRFPGERTGMALVLRAPVGVDWRFADDHAVGSTVNLNLGLLVRRSDPEDDLPLNRRLVPLPGIYYRLRR